MHGTQVLEQPDTSLPPPVGYDDIQVLTEELKGRRKWPVFAVAGGLVLALAGGVFGGRTSLQSQVDDLTSERDSLTSDVSNLTAERDSLISDVDGLTAERDSLMSDVSNLTAERDSLASDVDVLTSGNQRLSDNLSDERRQVTVLSASNAELRTGIEEARLAAEAIGFMALNMDSQAIDNVRQAGGDLTLYDALLAQLGRDETMEEWAATWDDFNGAWQQADRHVFDTDDEVLIEAWYAWNDSSFGTDEEYVTFDVLWTRAFDLVLERLMVLDEITP